MLENVKGFSAATVTFAVLITVVSALMGATNFSIGELALSLIFGAVVVGVSMLVNAFLLRSKVTNFKTFAISISGTLVVLFLVVAMLGSGQASVAQFVLGLLTVIVYGVVSAMAGSIVSGMKFK